MMSSTESLAIVVALFRLREGRSVAGYREFSEEYIRSEMMKFESIVWFSDHTVRPELLGGHGVRWQLAEVFAVTSIDDFVAENSGEHGTEVAAAWNEWVAESEVLLLEDLLQE